MWAAVNIEGSGAMVRVDIGVRGRDRIIELLYRIHVLSGIPEIMTGECIP